MKISNLLILFVLLLALMSCKSKNKAVEVDVSVADWGVVEQEITFPNESATADKDTTARDTVKTTD